MILKELKRLAALAAALLCLAAWTAGQAELTPVSTEKNGKVSQTVWTDEAGNPSAGPEGYATVRYSYKGDETTEMYFDAEDKPCECYGGYYGRKVTLDGKKRVIQIEYLDEEGDRMMNSMGYAMMTTSYYGFGEVRLVTYYGTNKKPVVVPSLGYASIYNEYSHKTLTSRTYRDAKNKPVDSAEGYAVVKQKVNKKFQVIRIRYEHANGKPATGPDGWYRCIKDRDDEGRITSIKYYDENEELTDRGADYAWEGREYQGDNTVLITRYDLADNKVADASGITTLVQEYKDDKVVKERFLDAQGLKTVNDIGVGTIVYGYDTAGRLETVTYQDTEGNPAECNLGYAGYRDTTDENGLTVSRIYLGKDGLATAIAGGYSEIRYFYDDAGGLTATRYYDPDGKQVQREEE